MNRNTFKLLLFVITIIVFIRLINFNFPSFTADEARVAYRGYAIAQTGKDELGRSFPVVFNSLTDYQLPATSYIAAIGEKIFGKTDFGVRMPFFIFGIGLIILTFKIAQLLNPNKRFWVTCAIVLVFSPALIFLSRIPNDAIVLTFFTTLIFYLLIRERLNILLVILISFLSFTVSKFAWFVVAPFIIFSLIFYGKNLTLKTKIILSAIVLLMSLTFIFFYLQIPQSGRSLTENNFSLFSNITLKNGINRSRGEGLQSGWPNYSETILFNKSYYFVAGFMHWLSNIAPSVYFAESDKSGGLNFSGMGVLSKVLVIPFVLGLIYLIRNGRKKEKLLLVYFLILTFPSIFIFPDFVPILVVLTLPFAAFVISYGLLKFNKAFLVVIIAFMVLDLCLNLIYLSPEEKNTNNLRPFWNKSITQDIYNQSGKNMTAVSDDISVDMVSFIEWYYPVDPQEYYIDVPYPYKFHQTNIKNIKLIGADSELTADCKIINFESVFLSKRDIKKIKNPEFIKIIKIYKNALLEDVAYKLERGLCIK